MHTYFFQALIWLLLSMCLTRPATSTSNCEGSSVDVQLCSSPQDISQVCPGQPVILTCTTVGSQFLAWSSPHYVSESGFPLFFSDSEDMVGTTRPSPNGASIGILTKVNSSGPIMLESQLHFNVSDQYSSSQIVCINTANGVNVTTTFIVGKKTIIPSSTEVSWGNLYMQLMKPRTSHPNINCV